MGEVIGYFPRTVEEFDALKKLDDHALRAIGCGFWDEGHYLYPKRVVLQQQTGIRLWIYSGTLNCLFLEFTDNDIRFGCLAYGFVKE